jgi:hypothetical protein
LVRVAGQVEDVGDAEVVVVDDVGVVVGELVVVVVVPPEPLGKHCE